MHCHAQENSISPLNASKLALLACFCLAIYIMSVTLSYAQPTGLTHLGYNTTYNSPMGSTNCTLVFWIYGNMGRGLAVLAITALGIGALLGKVTWSLALIVGVGISVLFGAPAIAGRIISNTATTWETYGGDCWN